MTALVANGLIQDFTVVAARLRTFSRIIAVDGGLNSCAKMGIVPDTIIGDLDSAHPELLQEYSGVECQKFPQYKDETDLELALKCIDANESFTVFGALGHRTDHALYNLHLLCRYPGKMIIETELEKLFALPKETIVHCTAGQTVSFIPLGGNVTGVTTQGLQWELQGATFTKDFMSISNICLQDSIHVRFTSGELLCSLLSG